MKTKSRIRFCAVIVVGLASILNNSCERLFKDNLPTVYTTGVFNLQPASVSFSGKITSTGGSGLPGGGRDGNGRFYSVGSGGFWWSSSESSTELGSYRSINFDYSNVFIYNIEKHYGFSVRCLQD